MPKDEDLPLGSIAARIPLRSNVIAAFTLRQERDPGSALPPLRGDDSAEVVHGGFVEARRFRAHKLPKKPRHRAFAPPQPFQ